MTNAGATARTAEMAPRRWPVRLILYGVVFALVVPGLLFCGVLLQQIATGERTRALESAQAAAQRTADTLDREVGNLNAALVALATSPALDTGDLAAFMRQARAVAAALDHPIVLSDLSGRQVVNTRIPDATALPILGSVETARRAIATGKPAVSGLFEAASNHAPSLAVQVPVLREGVVRGVLVTNIRPAMLSGIVQRQSLPPDWVVAVIDPADRIIARNIAPERLVGQVAAPDLRRHAVGEHAVWIGTTLDGVRALSAMQRMRLAEWRVAVGVPLTIVEAPLRQTITLLAVAGSVTLIMACVLAWQLANSVAQPLRRLALAGTAAAAGLPVQGVRSSISEVHAVSQALVQATRDLHSRAEALAAERAQLEAIIETVPVGLLIADARTGRIISGNSMLDRMLRHPIRRSQTIDDYDEWTARHADGRRVAARDYPLARVLRGEARPELQCLYERGDGTELWIQIVGAPIVAPDGTVTGSVVAVLDIDEAVRARDAKARFAERLETQVTERTLALQEANQRLRDESAARTAAEDQLRQAQKMEAVGQLTGGIAHDFNNLLTIVIGSLDLIRRRAPEGTLNDRTRRLLDNALEGATRAATLTARLLAFSRRQPLSPQKVDANRLVAGMSDLLHRTLGELVTVDTRLQPGLWPTHADPNQLENALLNLAVNARDAMGPAAGTITITTANRVLDEGFAAEAADVAPGEYVAVSVTDTGSGMDPEVAARVFEPFFTTKSPGQGTGLGLSQVHGFVKQSGGHVAIDSVLEHGTTVTICLPRFVGQDDAPPLAASLPVGEALPLTVLVVEDEAAVRRYSVEALRELGHTVFEACDGPEALLLLETAPWIDLLFSDVILPKMNGVQLAAAAHTLRPGLPVLFTSGYSADRAGSGLLLGPSDLLLTKPFTLMALAEKIREAVRPAGLEPATKPL